jgi:hypothetical protein
MAEKQVWEIKTSIKQNDELIYNKQTRIMSKEIEKTKILNISKIILWLTIIIIEIILVSQP